MGSQEAGAESPLRHTIVLGVLGREVRGVQVVQALEHASIT